MGRTHFAHFQTVLFLPSNAPTAQPAFVQVNCIGRRFLSSGHKKGKPFLSFEAVMLQTV